MKRLLFISILSLLAFSCQKEIADREGNFSITASKEALQTGSKATISDAGVFSWVSGDAIGLYNGSTFNKLTTTESGSSATFVGTVVGTPQNCAIFPYIIKNTPTSVTLPDSYQWKESDVMAPMIAQYNPTNLTFKHLAGIIKISLKNVPATATKFVFKANKDITGDFAINGDQIESTTLSDPAKNSVSFSFAAGTATNMDFYVPVPVGEFIITSVSLKDALDATLWEFEGATANQITRAKLLLMPTLTIVSIPGSGEDTGLSVTIPANYSGVYYLPETTSDVVLKVDATENPVTVAYKSGATSKPENVTIDCSNNVINNFTVNLPESHVELRGTQYTTLISKTSLSTLVVNEGTKINTLTVDEGSVDVKGVVADVQIQSTVQSEAVVRISNGGKVTSSINNDSQAEIQKSAAAAADALPAGGVTGSGNTDVVTSNSDETNDIVKSISEGASVTLSENLELYEPVDIYGVTNLELGGYTVVSKHSEEYLFAIHNGATLNVTGKKGTIDASNNIVAIKLTVKGDDPAQPAKLKITGKSTSSPVYVKGNWYAISGNGSRANTDVNLKYVNISAISGTAIYQPQPESKMVINNVVGTAPNSVVEIRSGNANIYGSETILKATANSFSAEKNGNGTTVQGAAIVVSQHTTNNPIEVSIGSGKYFGLYSVFFGDLQDNLNQESTSLIIRGGEFGKINHKNGQLSITGGDFTDVIESEPGKVISGGTFTVQPDDALIDTEALLYSATDNSTKWVYGYIMPYTFDFNIKDGTYKFYKDVTTKRQFIYSTSAIIDLGGHTITSTYASKGGCAIQNSYCSNGTIVFKNGTIDVQGECNIAMNATYNSTIVLDNDFTLKTKCGGVLLEYKPNPSTSRPIAGNGYLVMKAGSKIENTGACAAVQTNGSTNNNAEITINGGEIISNNGVGIYKPDAGTLTINGGTISGLTALYVKSGNTTIAGGTFNGNGAKAEYTYNENGCNPTGDALVVENCGYPGGMPVLSITGGTFNSTNAAAIESYAGNGQTEIAKGFVAKSGVTLNPSLPNDSVLWKAN